MIINEMCQGEIGGSSNLTLFRKGNSGFLQN
jgi:hypothetical protein